MAKAVLTGSIALACATATTAAARSPAVARAATLPTHNICRSTKGYETTARRLSRKLKVALRWRVSRIGLRVDDPRLGLECWLNGGAHFDSASAVKATILAALLRKAQEQQRGLTATERSEAWLMITQSNNSAATYLWNDVGMTGLQHFLNLAGMRHTYLGRGGYWGLTQITAHDEILLLRLLDRANRVLSGHSRRYELALMADVVSYQRWGVPAGAPAGFTVHVKNGWLPISGGWVINSIGTFTRPHSDYSIVVLTDGNPSMAYGITTIEKAAIVINRMLNPGLASVIPPSTPNPTWGIPDEKLPAAAFSHQ